MMMHDASIGGLISAVGTFDFLFYLLLQTAQAYPPISFRFRFRSLRPKPRLGAIHVISKRNGSPRRPSVLSCLLVARKVIEDLRERNECGDEWKWVEVSRRKEGRGRKRFVREKMH